MIVKVPDDIVSRAETNATEMAMLLAVQLYCDNRIDYIDACRLAGIPESLFRRELLGRAICVQQYPAAKKVRRSAV